MLFFRASRFLLLLAFPLLPILLAAQSPTPRLTHEIRNESRTVLAGSRSPIVALRPAEDRGPVPEGRPISGMTLTLKRSSAQEEELQTLLAAQLDPTSPQFHKWITPDQFAVRFDLAESDLVKVAQWLEQQGFGVEATGRSRDRITFSSNAGQVASAFGAPLHRFWTASGEEFAPAVEFSVPADLAPLVGAVLHLSTFRPTPQAHAGQAIARYTTAATQMHYLDPLDLATHYDVTPLYTAGVRGSGQSIAVVGQTYVSPNDFNSFGVALGLGSLSDYPVLVPHSGVEAISPGDEAESDLDLEYSIALAPGAQLFFVHVGDNRMYNVYDALRFAVTADIAPIISISYGGCEQDSVLPSAMT